jgi:hypothetical protein
MMFNEEIKMIEAVHPLPESLTGFHEEILLGCKKAQIVTGSPQPGLYDSGVPKNGVHPMNFGKHGFYGEFIAFQINLEMLPDFVHRNRLPKLGMVFVICDEDRDGKTFRCAYYDRPVESLKYNVTSQRHVPEAFREVLTPPFLVIDERFEWLEYLEEDFNDWVYKAFPFYRHKGFLQIGGNMNSCQSFYAENQEKFIAQMIHLNWLYDLGGITLYYDEERGFYVVANTH